MSEGTLEARHPGHVTGLQLAQRISSLTRLGLKRLLGTAQPAECLLSIEERLAIGPKKTLLLVNCAGQRFLLATTGEAIAPLFEVRPIAAQPFMQDGGRGAEAPTVARREGGL